MAKKFWERKEFKIERFAEIFHQVYDLYYDTPREQTDEYDMMQEGGQLMNDRDNDAILRMFAQYRQDILTSDREVAAFAVTYRLFQNRYKV